jgi:signal transduction histidine kinase
VTTRQDPGARPGALVAVRSAGRRALRPRPTGDTGAMLRTVVWLVRAAGFAVVALLTILEPPAGPGVMAAQLAGCAVVGVSLAAWALVDLHPAARPYRARWLAVILGVIALASGFAGAADGGTDGAVVFAIVAALSAGSEAELAEGVAVAAAGILAIEIGGIAYGAGFGTLLGFPLLVVVALLIGRNRGAYRVQAEQSAALLAQYERLRAEQRRADVLDERARIAREIHDVLAHSLGALGIQIQAAKAILTDQGDLDRAVEVLGTAQRMAADGLVETRRAVHALRVDTLPLNEELARAAEVHGRRHHVAVAFGVEGDPRPLPPEATVALLRTAQEALVNAAKHAAGRGMDVRLGYGARYVRLVIANDLAETGAGDPHAAGSADGGYGLTGMRERLRLLDGTLDAGPRQGRWTVTAELPLTAPPRPENVPV